MLEALTDNELDALEHVRVARDWTYRELAALTGVGVSPLCRAIKRKTVPNARTAFKIRRFLELRSKRRRSA